MPKFSGADKYNAWFLAKPEKRLAQFLASKTPRFLETYHLTLLTVIWSACVIWFGYKAIDDIRWLCGTSIMLVFQYITDIMDGAVGKMRGTGLMRWGYYMDHFLDYIFTSALFVGYFFIFYDSGAFPVFVLYIICSSFMAHSFLMFGSAQRMQVDFCNIGPTLVRALFILMNIFITWKYSLAKSALWYLVAVIGLLLIILVYRGHKEVWQMDMEEKNK